MSTSSATRPAAGGARRAAAAVSLAIVLLAPLSVIFTQFWISRSDDLTFNEDERRGVEYLGPLTGLLSVVTEQQSLAIQGSQVVTSSVRQSVAAVDAVDAKLGARLHTTQRWTQLRKLVLDATSRTFAGRNNAFVSYSGVVDLTVALIRKVGDSSNLILDPKIDAYYVMNATLLRIPMVLVDSGRYTDLVKIVLTSGRSEDPDSRAQLASMRGRILTGADDLSDGLEKAFESTDSNTLGPGVLRQLDDFRTAVDAISPRASIPQAAATAMLDPEAVDSDQDALQQVTMGLDQAALGQLDALLKARVDAIARQRLYAVVALLTGVLVTAGVVAMWFGPARRHAGDAPPPMTVRHGERADAESVDPRDLVASSGTALPARPGGARAAR
jgi:hypothetical protein